LVQKLKKTAAKIPGTGPTKEKPAEGERLQRVVVVGGSVSRRKAGELILEGRVAVNGTTENSPGKRVDPHRDQVTLDGTRLRFDAARTEAQYILFYKPRGMVSTMSDPEGRPCLGDVTGLPGGRLFPAGRLDFNTDGLIVLTTDGEFAQKITHPRHGCRKTYRVKVRGMPSTGELDRLRAGMVLDGRRTKAARIIVLPGKVRNCQLQVVIGEGRRNQIRRMFERIGHPVVKLTREAIGTVKARGITPGEYRRLTSPELKALRHPGEQERSGIKKRYRPTGDRNKSKRK
jgi:23S rRNA pseudouridine2605 synthase